MGMKWKHYNRIDKKVIVELYIIIENFLHCYKSSLLLLI